MTGLPDFRERQRDLRRRLQRQAPRSQVRRRLERELRGLVAAELRLESAPSPQKGELEPEPNFPQTHWMQRWEDQQEGGR